MLWLVDNPLASTRLPSLGWEDVMHRLTNYQLGGFQFEARNVRAREEKSRGWFVVSWGAMRTLVRAGQ